MSNNEHNYESGTLTGRYNQTATQKIKPSNKRARMPNGYKPKFIKVQTLVEMKDVVEEEGRTRTRTRATYSGSKMLCKRSMRLPVQ